MRDGHAFRSICIALALILALTLAGCGALGGGDGGGGCGPGDTEIADVADSDAMGEQQQVSFTGEVVAAEGQDGAGGASYAIDDGTGTAFITAPPGDIGEGDCVTVEGYAYANPTDAGADVIIAPDDVSQAE